MTRILLVDYSGSDDCSITRVRDTLVAVQEADVVIACSVENGRVKINPVPLKDRDGKTTVKTASAT